MRVAAKSEAAPMRVAQIPKPGGDFEIVEREIPNAGAGRCESRFRPVVFATVTCLRRKVYGLELSTSGSSTRSPDQR